METTKSPLDEAAEAARKGLEGLDLEEVGARFQERAAALRARREKLATCWDALGTALGSVISRIDEEGTELRQACERTVTGLTGFIGPLQEDSESMEDAVQLALEASAGLSQVPGALMDEVSSALVDRGLEPATVLVMATHELVDVTAESLEAVVDVIGPEFFAVAENSQAMAKLNVKSLGQAADSVSAALAGDFEDWSRRMGHAVSHVDQHGYTPARAHVATAVSETLQDCLTTQEPVFERVDGSFQAAQLRLTELGAAMARILAAMPQRSGDTTRAGLELVEALGEARPALAAVREMLAANGFGTGA